MYADVLSDKVKEIFISDMADIPEVATNHKFSLGYRIKRRRVISYYSKKTRHPRETIPRRVKLAVVVTVIFLVALIAGFVTYRYISGFYVEDNNEYALIKTDEAEECTVIKEKFYLDMDLSGYEAEVVADNKTYYSVCFTKDGKNITISQYPISRLGEIRADLEYTAVSLQSYCASKVNLQKVQNTDKNRLFYYKTKKYILIITCDDNFDENFIIDLVKFTKFK